MSDIFGFFESLKTTFSSVIDILPPELAATLSVGISFMCVLSLKRAILG